MPPRTSPTGAHEISRISLAIADRYRIERVLGEGGMATVYLAEDLKHHRKVAVKVMRPELSETLGAERFLREVEIAARLSHPSILPVFDSGQSEGFLYYVMPYVEGESLPARLSRMQQLPAAEALRIAREVAEALAYAHRNGVVHRDIKPANILLSEGHALVADFGIARAASGGGNALTQAGMAIGTPQYMSPEQAMGSGEIDGRADIYALGCVLYEMISGEPPFTGPTAQAVISRAMTESPRPLSLARQGLVPAVAAVTEKALARSAADRYQTAEELASALEGAENQTRIGTAGMHHRAARPLWQKVAAIVGLVAVVGAGVASMLGRDGGVGKVNRLAILPFTNQGDSADAYFADGIVDEVRGKLARLEGLMVTASTSSGQYRDSDKNATEIARELGVDYLLVGRVRWLADRNGDRRVQLVSELVDGRTGTTTWQESFDGHLTDVFQMQSSIATRVANELGAALGSSDQEDLGDRPTSNSLAYDLYLRGRAIVDNSASAQRRASSLYEQAVALDGEFAEAWSGLSGAQARVYSNGSREMAAGLRAREAMERALALDPDGREPLMAGVAFYSLVVDDFDSAGVMIERALGRYPRDPAVLAVAGRFESNRGRADAAVKHLEAARELDPRSGTVLAGLLTALVAQESFSRAISVSDEVLDVSNNYLQDLQTVIDAYLGARDLEGAKAVIQRGLQRIPAPELVAYFAGFNELAWLLDQEEYELLFRLTPAAFDNDRGWWGQSLAFAAHQRGDSATARAYADSGLVAAAEQVAANPEDPQLRVLYAVMLAILGRADEARAEARRSMSGAGSGGSANNNYTLFQQAGVEMALGDHDAAIRALSRSRAERYPSKGRLLLDPTFAKLRGMPAFEALVR